MYDDVEHSIYTVYWSVSVESGRLKGILQT